MSLTFYPVEEKPKPKKQDKGLIYLKVRIGKVDIVNQICLKNNESQ